jgi:inositol oxygenase
MSTETIPPSTPLQSLDEWEDFLKATYPEADQGSEFLKNLKREQSQFRDYRKEARPSVKEFYRVNHQYQTLDFVLQKKADFLSFSRKEMGIWEAAEFLNQLVDDSDPDTDLSQLQHLLQTSEAIRTDGHPDWFVLTGFIHDLGKILCLFGEPQWAVVGDTFPVGCKYSEKVVFSEFFELNPDIHKAELQTKNGIYEEGCGLDKVHLSWGHDEYIYHIAKPYIPEEGLYMLRYHSFYAAHKEHEYQHLMNEHDKRMFEWVRRFNPYDLYSKAETPPDVEKLKPYYQELIAKYFPPTLRW